MPMIVATVTWELRLEHRLPAGVRLPMLDTHLGKAVSEDGLATSSGVALRHVIEQMLELYGFRVQGGGCGFGVSDVNVLCEEAELPRLQEMLMPYELPELVINTRPHEGGGVL